METINKNLKRNNIRVLPNLSNKSISYEKGANFDRAIAAYQFNKEDEKLEDSIKKLWLDMIREEMTVPRKFYDSIISILKDKVTPRALKSIISTVYKRADSDMIVNVINDSSFGLMSIEHRVTIKYHHCPINSYVPVILRKNVYMVIIRSAELFVAIVPPNVNLKHCKVIKLARRPYVQDWHYPIVLSTSYIISIATQVNTKIVRFLVYDIAKDRWSIFPNVPIENTDVSFTSWIYKERYVHVFASNGNLYRFDMLGPEDSWEITVVNGNIEGINNRSNLMALQYTMNSSLIITDGKINRFGEIVRGNSNLFILNHKNNTIRLYIRLYDPNVRFISSTPRLYKRWYLFLNRGFFCYSLKRQDLHFEYNLSMVEIDAVEY